MSAPPAGDGGASDAPTAPEPARPRGTGGYGWLVALAVLGALAYITLNSVRTQGRSSRGVPAGQPAPPFAVPLADSGIDKDANVARARGEGASGARPACEIRGRGILTSCDLWESRPAALVFIAAPGKACRGELEVAERVRARFPAVSFAGVAVRADRPGLEAFVRRGNIGFPVGFDRDGAVFSRYGVLVCPTVTLVRPGGRVARTLIGLQDEAQLTRAVGALAAERGRR